MQRGECEGNEVSIKACKFLNAKMLFRLKKKQNRLAKKESEKSTKNIHQEGQSSPDHELNSDGEAEEPHFVIGGK